MKRPLRIGREQPQEHQHHAGPEESEKNNKTTHGVTHFLVFIIAVCNLQINSPTDQAQHVNRNLGGGFRLTAHSRLEKHYKAVGVTGANKLRAANQYANHKHHQSAHDASECGLEKGRIHISLAYIADGKQLDNHHNNRHSHGEMKIRD